MIVKEYQNGSGRVCFHDDFIKPKEEQERIMNALTEKVQGWLVSKTVAKGNIGGNMLRGKQ